MKKVLYVSTYGGFLTDFQINNMKIWKNFGYEIHCASNFKDPKCNRHLEKLNEVGAVLHQVDFTRSPYSATNYRAYKTLSDIIRNEEIEILDTHNPVSSILSRLAAKRNGVKKILYTVHGFFFYKGAPIKNQIVFRPIEFFMARMTDNLIVTNIEDYEVAKRMKVRGNAFYVHGVGVDVSNIHELVVDKAQKRQEFSIPDDAILMISIGENIRRKNHEAAIRAFANVKRKNVYYMIVGDGELHDYLKQLAKDLGVLDYMIFPGYREDANELLKMADIYVFPSFQEGLSVALMQAMAARLPVIASNIRGNIDCIKDGYGGITVAPRDICALTSAMKILIEDQEMRERYGEYNSSYVEHFSKDVVSKEYNEIFKTMVE